LLKSIIGISGFLSKISSGVVVGGVVVENTITGERKLILETGESAFGAKGSISGDRVVLERYSAKQMDEFAKKMINKAVKIEEALVKNGLDEVMGCDVIKNGKNYEIELKEYIGELKNSGKIKLSDEQIEGILTGEFSIEDEARIFFGENILREAGLLGEGQFLTLNQKRAILLAHYTEGSNNLKFDILRVSDAFDFTDKCHKKMIKKLGDAYVFGEITSGTNTYNFNELKKVYRIAEANGVSPENINDAYETFYHAYPKSDVDFSLGLDATKSKDGFYFTKNRNDAISALENMGYNTADLEIIEIKIAKNIYYSSPSNPLVKPAPTWESDAYYIPVNQYKRFNDLMKDDWAKIEH